MIKINYLLQELKEKNILNNAAHIYINHIIEHFCEIYYKDIKNKRLYTLDDFIQEVWLEFLIMVKNNNYEFISYKHFYYFIRLITKIILLRINKQGGFKS